MRVKFGVCDGCNILQQVALLDPCLLLFVYFICSINCRHHHDGARTWEGASPNLCYKPATKLAPAAATCFNKFVQASAFENE
jgi:hypothetical protein